MAKIELFLVWESNCRSILEQLQVLPDKLLDQIKVRIFLRKDTPAKSRPLQARWIELYHSFTTSPYASDTTLAAFLIKYFKDLACFSDEEEAIDSTCEPVEFYLIVDSESERKYEELIAILELQCKSKVKLCVINGQVEDIPEVLGFNVCKKCNLAFEGSDGLENHNTEAHNFFCDSPDCPRNKVRFYSESELKAHKAQQTTCLLCHEGKPTFCDRDTKAVHMQTAHGQEVSEKMRDELRCDFCPKKMFSSAEQRDAHMRNTHKKCNCGCALYFKSRAHYLEHFYTVYPLACFENRKCPHRFRTVFHQSEHHKRAHNSEHPYYCTPCSTWDENAVARGVGKMCAFKEEKTLRRHGSLMRHSEEEMYLIEEASDKPTAKSSAINYC